MEENICTNKYKTKQILLKLLLYTVYISLIGLIMGQIQAITDFSYTLHELMYLPVNIAIYIVPIELIAFIYYWISMDNWKLDIWSFTRTGVKINGYVEMASINQKNEVEINKSPFTMNT